MIRTARETETEDFNGCHDGHGLTRARMVLSGSDSAVGIQFMHDDLIEPGASIGEHGHTENEEVYFIVSGTGNLVLDGKIFPVGPGDVSVCSPGHSHGIVNTGPGDLRLLVTAVEDNGK